MGTELVMPNEIDRQEKIIEVQGLSKSFNGHSVISDVSFSVNSGDSLVIIGKSGTGKSVLLKCIIGLLYPDTGTVKINNLTLNYNNQNKIVRDIGVLFQQPALFDSMNVWENITFGLNIKNKKQAMDLAAQLLHDVDLSSSILEHMPSEISGGMQRRVSLARTIAKNPKILIFDEPTTGLDPITSNAISQLILRTINRTRATAISVTHDVRYMFNVANRVILLDNGQIVWNNDLKQIMHTQNQLIRQFIPSQDELQND